MDEQKTPEQPADVVLKVHDSFIGQTGTFHIPAPPPVTESEEDDE